VLDQNCGGNRDATTGDESPELEIGTVNLASFDAGTAWLVHINH